MPDSVTLGALVAGGIASKEVLTRFLGPTADLAGEGLRDVVASSGRNVAKIFDVAIRRVGSRLDKPGQVNTRVFKGICDEGRFVSNELVAEYFGGILASSRSEDGEDDSNLSFLSRIRSLSCMELKLHFMLYASAADCAINSRLGKSLSSWDRVGVSVNSEDLFVSLASDQLEAESEARVAIDGLRNAGLVGAINRDEDEETIELQLRDQGARLLLKVIGLQGVNAAALASLNIQKAVSETALEHIELPESARLVPFFDAEESVKGLEVWRDSIEEDVDEKIASLSEKIEELQGTLEQFKDDKG